MVLKGRLMLDWRFLDDASWQRRARKALERLECDNKQRSRKIFSQLLKEGISAVMIDGEEDGESGPVPTDLTVQVNTYIPSVSFNTFPSFLNLQIMCKCPMFHSLCSESIWTSFMCVCAQYSKSYILKTTKDPVPRCPSLACLPLPRKLCAVCVVPSSFTCVTCGDRYCSLKYLERSYVLASCGGLTNYKIFFNESLFSNEHTIWDRHANEGGHPAEDQQTNTLPAAEEFTEEILIVPIMCSYLASRCCCDMSMWCIFDCISLWALALPSSSFIPSTFNDFRKSYFVITIINHNHVTCRIHIHLFIIHSTIFFWMRQGRGRRALLFAKQKRLFLSRVSKLG